MTPLVVRNPRSVNTSTWLTLFSVGEAGPLRPLLAMEYRKAVKFSIDRNPLNGRPPLLAAGTGAGSISLASWQQLQPPLPHSKPPARQRPPPLPSSLHHHVMPPLVQFEKTLPCSPSLPFPIPLFSYPSPIKPLPLIPPPDLIRFLFRTGPSTAAVTLSMLNT